MNGESEGGVRIGDCYVWAEIYYLDSPTDYREYLPQHCARQCPVADDLVMLDSSVFSRTSRPRHLLLWPLVLLCALSTNYLPQVGSVWSTLKHFYRLATHISSRRDLKMFFWPVGHASGDRGAAAGFRLDGQLTTY
jgi:hypothetical protein